MKTGRKWKSSSPEPTHAKVARREPRAHAESRLTFSPEKRIFTPSKRKVPNTSSPRRNSSRFKCHGQETGKAESGFEMVQTSSSLESSPLQSEVDAELGLVIRLDEEETSEPEQLRKSGGKPLKELPSNDYRAMADNERDAEGSDLDEDSEEEFRKLDRDLAVKSKQHNLTSVHVRSIIHEVITNEHVVAMMKAAIRETQDMPMFEPKMTRSKLKEVVEKGVGMPNWNISPIKQSKELKPPQFVDILLEDEEDSSDEEYYPDEDEEDETAEETILESDMDSIASSPRISRRARSCTPIEVSEVDEERSNSPQMKQRHLRVEAVPMGPPAPPSQSGVPSRPLKALDSFMEKLHAVDEELDFNPLSIEPYPTLSSGENAEQSLVAGRTRSKRPLKDVPLDQLEAELKAPDITPDMYDCASALEDKEWSHWLQGLMTSHLYNEEDGDDDDDDDPEYNFLEDLDEPDLEDYRNDRAVRITKKEVNELMEELFETFQDEVRVNEDEDAHEEDGELEKVSSQSPAKFNVPQAIRFEEPLAHMLTECRRTVREQLDVLQQRREQQSQPQCNAPGTAMILLSPPCTLMVTPTQKQQLQQQVQQHVQLLTQVNMLCSSVEALQSQATTTKLFLMELQSFAERAEQMRAVVDPGFKSAFRVCNLQPSMDLLEELEKTASQTTPQPRSTKSHAVHRYPFLPPHLAWLFATRSAFLYPELLPHCSLDPALQPPRSKTIYTKGEDGLIVLGLKHFSETEFPYHLMSQYLLQPKRVEQLRVRVKDMCTSRTTDSIIKFYCQHHTVPPLPVACCPVVAGSERPPVERDKIIMPNWLLKSLPCIHKAVFQRQSEETTSSNIRTNSPPLSTFPEGTQYPLSLPKGLNLQLHPSAKRKTSVRPHKPRPLHGFARPASTPLAKAPLCPVGTVNLLSRVPAPLPSQGVILLTQSPLIPVNEALPVNQETTTPAHGTVPLNSVAAVNVQYIVPQQGCVNSTEPPASLPPATVHIPSTLACNRPIPANGVGKCINILQTKAEVPRKQIMPRQLLPIQPSPFSPNQLHHHTPVSVTPSSTAPSANFMDYSSHTAPSMVIIQPSSLLDTPYVHPPADSQGLVKSSNTPPPQDSFTQQVSGRPLSGTLSRPLHSHMVKISSPDTNKEPVDSEFELKSSPVFFSHTPSPPLHMTESPKSSPRVQSVCDQEQSLPTVKGKFACDALVSNYQSKPLPDAIVNSTITANHDCSSLLLSSRTIRDKSRTTSPQGLSAHNDASNSHMLLQAASQAGTPQSFLLPITSLIPSQPQLHLAKRESKVPQQKIAHKTFSTSSMPDHLSLLTVGMPLEGATGQAPHLPRTEMCDGKLWKEDMEAGAEVGGEDMANALFASPLLKLPESSCRSHSNLRNISHMDSSTVTLKNVMESNPITGEQHSSHFSQERGDCTTKAPADTNRSKGQMSSTGEVPGLLTFTSGTENQQTPGGDGGLNKKYGGGEGEGHPNEESGGEERDANDDGERGGNGDGGRERQGNGGRDGHDDDKDGEREEEEEDFDELTQDEDEEEVMSSASEESVLSVPELQETMEKLTWLASERRLCGEGDSEEDNSPNSPTSPTSPISQNSQEENSEDEEDGAIKGEDLEPTEGDGGKLPEGDAPQEDDPPQISGKGAGRGRGRARPPPRSLRKSRRQERGSKDTSKLLLLCDDHILDSDPMRESKDIAYAQAYLSRVREALQDTPGKVEEFLSLLYEFEQGIESRNVVELFRQLQPLLKDWPELLRDFAAFLLPEQALECGLFEEQQAFERSRRFLRQLEISFGENPSHYQKIVKALQAASAPTPAGVEELKTQMATLLKGRTHLQGEFSAFFDMLRPPQARPGQFEEAIWPEDGGNMTEGGDGLSLGSGGFEEVTLPDLEEEEETPKIPQITGKSRKRKELGTHRDYKACNWPEKHCPCHCHFSSHDAKHRRHKRKGCPRCHGIKATVDSKSLKTGDHSFPTAEPLPEKQDEREESEKGEEKKETETDGKDESCGGANSPHHEPEVQAWECTEADPLANPEERDADEEEEEEWKEGEQCSFPHTSTREEEVPTTEYSDTFVLSEEREMAQQNRQSPSSETPVCAKNISLTPSGEKVVLWTREADRVILTACQQQGASQSTFQCVSAQLGNKTANEVSKRFRDLMRLFHTSARQASSDEEATEQQSATDEEQD